MKIVKYLLLLIPMTLGLMFTTNHRTLDVNALLPSPVDYDWSYKYDAGYEEWQIRNYTQSIIQTPEYSTFTTSAFTYTSSITSGTSLYSDLQITLNLGDPNTSFKASGIKWIPDTAHIGTTQHDIDTDAYISISVLNNSNNDYIIKIDLGEIVSDDIYTITEKYNNETYTTYFSGDFLYTKILPAKSNYGGVPQTLIFNGDYDQLTNLLISAIYIKSLGISSAYTAGTSEGYTSAYIAGNSAGYSSGYTAGNSAGYSSGYIAGNSAGYSSGYNEGVLIVEEDAYTQGYEEGARESFLGNIDKWIVPAIIIVLFLGGAISIWSIKLREG